MNASLQQKILTRLVSEVCDRIVPLLLVRLSALSIRKARDIEDLQLRHGGPGISEGWAGHFDDLLRVRLRTVGELAAWTMTQPVFLGHTCVCVYVYVYIKVCVGIIYIHTYIHYITLRYITLRYVT